MRIAQIILPSASEYDRKSQRIDRAALSASHDVVETTIGEAGASGAVVAHLYGRIVPAAEVRRLTIPYVASVDAATSRWSLRKPRPPRFVASPLVTKADGRMRPLPEAVEETYFERGDRDRTARAASAEKIIGSYARESVRNAVEQALSRIQRFRSDVLWRLFDYPPSPEDLASLDLWVDPATSDEDLDGFVAEALVSALPVVATRTAINALRLEKGRTGTLVPPRDPNEMTHAILAALFKPESAAERVAAARHTILKFKSRQRLRSLVQMYAEAIQ